MPHSLRNVWAQAVGYAWADEAFRRRLLADPIKVLAEMGVELPSGHQIEVFEDTPDKTHLALPLKPAGLGDVGGEMRAAPPTPDACCQAAVKVHACCQGVVAVHACCQGAVEVHACCQGAAPACCQSVDRAPACCQGADKVPACCQGAGNDPDDTPPKKS